MKKVFISRGLHNDSVFFKKLVAKGYGIFGESLVDFTAVPVSHLPAADWLFFYSQNGVRFLLEQVSPDLISGIRLAAMGPGTANALKSHGLQVDFSGDGIPENTATAFLQTAKGQKVLFCRAKESRHAIRQMLEPYVTVIDLVVYENWPRTDFKLPDFDILVFTSSMNATAFFAKKKWITSQVVIAIGKTTATTLAELGIGKVITASHPSEEALAEAVLSL